MENPASTYTRQIHEIMPELRVSSVRSGEDGLVHDVLIVNHESEHPGIEVVAQRGLPQPVEDHEQRGVEAIPDFFGAEVLSQIVAVDVADECIGEHAFEIGPDFYAGPPRAPVIDQQKSPASALTAEAQLAQASNRVLLQRLAAVPGSSSTWASTPFSA
jgi:hypothetical protein